MTDKEKVDFLVCKMYEAICIMEDPKVEEKDRAYKMYHTLLMAVEKVKEPLYDDWGSFK